MDVQDRQYDVSSSNLVGNVLASGPINFTMSIGYQDNILDVFEMFAVFHDDVHGYNQS
jgi:hypothetical protein